MPLTRNALPKRQLWIALSAGLSTCSCWTRAPGQPEILKNWQFHYRSKNRNLQTHFQKSAPSESQKNEQLKVLPGGLTDLQYYFQFTFCFCSVHLIFSKLIPLGKQHKMKVSRERRDLTREFKIFYFNSGCPKGKECNKRNSC